MENWKPVAGFEGLYEVSDIGRVRGLKRGKVRSLHVNSSSPHLWLDLWKEAKHTNAFVHVLVLSAFVGPRPPGMSCRHLDGDATNNRVANLRWGTVAENTADKIRHGTHPHGVTHGRAKLTEAQVLEILRTPQISNVQWGKRLGVSHRTVAYIRTGQRWTHIRRTV